MRNNIIDIKRTESSPTEPCTLAEAKAQAIVTYTDDDTLITALITKARKMIENYCSISIVTQSVILTADLYNEWELPYGPVTGITGVSTRSPNQGSGPMTYTTQTSGWGQDGVEFITFIPAFVGDFNINIAYTGVNTAYPWKNRYKITYTTGYGVVPDDLKQAVLVQIVWLLEHRGEEKDDVICEAAQVYARPYFRNLWQ